LHDPELVELGASLSLFSVSIATELRSESVDPRVVALVKEHEQELKKALRRCGLGAHRLKDHSLKALVDLGEQIDSDVAAKFGNHGVSMFRLAIKLMELQASVAFSIPSMPDRDKLIDLAHRASVPSSLVHKWSKNPSTGLNSLRKYVINGTGSYYDRLKVKFLNRPLLAIVVLAIAIIAALLGVAATVKDLL